MGERERAVVLPISAAPSLDDVERARRRAWSDFIRENPDHGKPVPLPPLEQAKSFGASAIRLVRLATTRGLIDRDDELLAQVCELEDAIHTEDEALIRRLHSVLSDRLYVKPMNPPPKKPPAVAAAMPVPGEDEPGSALRSSSCFCASSSLYCCRRPARVSTSVPKNGGSSRRNLLPNRRWSTSNSAALAKQLSSRHWLTSNSRTKPAVTSTSMLKDGDALADGSAQTPWRDSRPPRPGVAA
jgi:hypothetical protein